MISEYNNQHQQKDWIQTSKGYSKHPADYNIKALNLTVDKGHDIEPILLASLYTCIHLFSFCSTNLNVEITLGGWVSVATIVARMPTVCLSL